MKPAPDVETVLIVIGWLDQDSLRQLTPDQLERLSDALYRGHSLCELAADEQPFPRIRRRPEAPKEGVLACLRKGERAE